MLSPKANIDPTRTYGAPTPTATTTETPSSLPLDLHARVSGVAAAAGEGHGVAPKTIWDKINSPSTQRVVRGGSPVVPVRGSSSPVIPVRGILQPTQVRKYSNVNVYSHAS